MLVSRSYISRRRRLLPFLSVFGVIRVGQVLLNEWENLAPPGSGPVVWLSPVQGPLVAAHLLPLGCQLPAALESPSLYSSVPLTRGYFFPWSKLTEGTGTLAQYRRYTVSQGTHLPQCDSVRATHISQLLGCKKQKLGDEAEGSQDSGLGDRRK